MSKIDEWGVAAELIDLQGKGVSGKPAARAVRPKVEAWAKRAGQPVPTVEAIAKAIGRYFDQPARDGRTRQARSQLAVEGRQEEHKLDLAERQVDAIASLEQQFRWVQQKGAQVDGLLDRLEQLAKDKGAELSTSAIRDAAVAFKAFSSEQRGWLELLVDVKDRLWAHRQYELAFSEILAAIMTEAPDRAPAIAQRLRSNPIVANVLRVRAVSGGGDGA